MKKLLIFGGTTEGRQLAEWCAANGIAADVSVTTDYGARLLGSDRLVNIFTGKLDRGEMETLIRAGDYAAVADATHPYAAEATQNIRAACGDAGARYYRLLREKSELSGTVVSSLDETVELLERSDKMILSTLGSKELPGLAGVRDCKRRVWLRVLPADGIEEYCVRCGFERSHIITGRGPFSVEENVRHIKQCGAEILLTKESGAAGGYPEKIAAARECNIGTITIARPAEDGYSFEQLTKIIGDII